MNRTYAVEFFNDNKKIGREFVTATSEVHALDIVTQEGKVPKDTRSVEVTQL